MSDYARANSGGATHFTDKDALSTGDANKKVVGSQVDAEYNAILTATNSKYDSNDIASQAEAEGESSNIKLMTPLRVANWADENGGLVGEIQELADPGADGIIGWDDGASANANVVFFTAGTALAFSGTTIEMSHLGIEDLADPGADRIAFWDDSETKTDWLSLGTDLAISGTTLSYDLPTALDGADVSGVTTLAMSSVNVAADGVMVSDSGVLKLMPFDEGGVPVVNTANASQTFALTDANTMQILTGVATTSKTFTIPLNASVAFQIGTVILVKDLDGFGTALNLIIAAASGVLITSFIRDTVEAGGGESTHTILRGGGAALIKVATDKWSAIGDIS